MRVTTTISCSTTDKAGNLASSFKVTNVEAERIVAIDVLVGPSSCVEARYFSTAVLK